MQFRCSRASDECNKKQPSDCDTLEYRNGEGTFIARQTAPTSLFYLQIYYRYHSPAPTPNPLFVTIIVVSLRPRVL